MLRIRRVFISHTHIDHAIGLDHLLRMQIYSPQPLDIYGPPGLIEQFSGRLQGYAWNLTGDSPYTVELHELHAQKIVSRLLRCRDQFRTTPSRQGESVGALTLREGCTLSWVKLDHGVPCLGFRLTGRPFYRFRPQQARALGLAPGPWISELKNLAAEQSWETSLSLPSSDGRSLRTVAEWSELLLEREDAPTLAYITDTLLGESQRERLGPFVRSCQQLWCEATYRDEDKEKAATNLHATASQAALLACEAEVGELRLFHLSRRYQGESESHLLEARRIFPGTQLGEVIISS